VADEVTMMQHPLLDVLAEEDRRAITAHCTRARFPSGAFVFHAGEAGDTLHIIAKGRVAVLAGGWGGDPVTLAILGVGEVFGELALLGDDHRTATIRAIEPSETLILRAADFDRLRAERPKLNDFLITILAQQVARLTRQVIEIAEVPASKRVYRRLVELAAMFGGEGDGAAIPVSQDQLASMASTKLRITNKVIAEARAAGLVSTGRRRILILNYEGLRQKAR
jgi:CRP/FNR family cyclic AMP-dependent transcriptional regulator